MIGRNGKPRVTPEQITKIRSLLGTISQYEIARIVGVSQFVVSKVNTGALYTEKKKSEFFEHDPWYSYNPKR